jgi:hypothetical protein
MFSMRRVWRSGFVAASAQVSSACLCVGERHVPLWLCMRVRCVHAMCIKIHSPKRAALCAAGCMADMYAFYDLHVRLICYTAGAQACCPVCRLPSGFDRIKKLVPEAATLKLSSSLSHALLSLTVPATRAGAQRGSRRGDGGGGALELLSGGAYLDFVLLDTYSSTNCFHTREVLKSTPVDSSKEGPGGVWVDVAAAGDGFRAGQEESGPDRVSLEDTFLPQPFQRVCGSILPYLPFPRGVAGWLGMLVRAVRVFMCAHVHA